MKDATVKIRKDLFDRAASVAKVAGYSSPAEFIEHVLERELARIEPGGQDDEAILEKLKGLGYID